MAFEHYIRSGQKQLRCGYTTGSCAALAAAGAASLLLTGELPALVSLRTPKGWEVEVEPLCPAAGPGWAECAVRKDGGDDPDITHGTLIFARVRPIGQGIAIVGGTGVGRVTKPGLDQPVGEAAINRVPRQMIGRAVEDVCRRAGYRGGMEVTVSVPEGEALAKKTFNPHLGIVGGISILGTSGIVEPMSERALVDSLELEIRQARTQSRRLILTPGNYGADFLAEKGWDRLGVPVVRCSNYIGEALDSAAAQGFEQVLLAGHMGKLCKLAAGIMNTHSRAADGRSEIFCAHAALAGAGQALCREIMEAATTDRCLELLEQAGLARRVCESLTAAAGARVARRAGENMETALVLFSNQYGLLGASPTAKEFIEQWQKTT